MPSDQPKQDGWPTVLVLAVIPLVVSVLFGRELAHYNVPFPQILFAALVTFTTLFEGSDRIRTAWKRSSHAAHAERDQI